MGLAIKVVVALSGGPAKNATLVFRAAPSTVAVTFLRPACVEVSVVVKTPRLFVVPEAGENTLEEPVALIVTTALTIGAPAPSATVTVTMLVSLPFAMRLLGLAAMVEFAGLTTGVVNVTFALTVTVPPTSALRVSVCTVVEDTVVVNTPDASVLPEADEKLLFTPLVDMDTD